jgi:DNA-binding NarL/FixJ family response regulator
MSARAKPRLPPPRDLRAWELVVGRDVYVLFEWGAAQAVEPANLTKAEGAVLRQLLQGQSNAQIARLRGTALRTVTNQISSLFRKLGVHSRTELIARLMRR